MEWLTKIVYSLFFMIDKLLFWIISKVYALFIEISELSIFSPETIQKFGRNIYVLLGIFMLFKVSFSLLTYVVNPDSFSDKEKGVNKLVTNILSVLVLLILTPWIFREAMNLQVIILKDDTIGNIILGMNSTPTSDRKDAGKQMAYTAFTAFFHIDLEKYPECDVVSGYASDYTEEQLKATGNDNPYNACKSKLGNDDAYKKFERASKTKDMSDLDSSLIWAEGSDDKMIVDYTFLISSAVGVVMILILLVFCFDIAIRSVKLGFLQLIAPIPIISRVDPKSAKGGMFSKWVKTCTSTYIDLFVRLMAIYFAIFIISEIASGGLHNVIDPDTKISLWAKVFIILGALMFAKDLPKLLQELIPGLKVGDFSLNPMKKLGQSPFAAAAVGGVAGAVGGFAANSFALGKTMKEKGFKDALTGGKTGFAGFRSAMGNAFTGVAGAGSAGFRGLRGGLAGGGKGSALAPAKNAVRESNARRYNRDMFEKQNYGFLDRNIKDPLYNWAGIKNDYGGSGKLDKELNQWRNDELSLNRSEERNREIQTGLRSEFISKYNMNPEEFDGAFERDFDPEKDIYSDNYNQKALETRRRLEQQAADRFRDNQEMFNKFKEDLARYESQETLSNYDNTKHEELKKRIAKRQKMLDERKKATDKK